MYGARMSRPYSISLWATRFLRYQGWTESSNLEWTDIWEQALPQEVVKWNLPHFITPPPLRMTKKRENRAKFNSQSWAGGTQSAFGYWRNQKYSSSGTKDCFGRFFRIYADITNELGCQTSDVQPWNAPFVGPLERETSSHLYYIGIPSLFSTECGNIQNETPPQNVMYLPA